MARGRESLGGESRGRASDVWGKLANTGEQLYNTRIWYPIAVILRMFEFILSFPVLGILARFIDVYNLHGTFPNVAAYLWIPLGASIASIVYCIFFVVFTIESGHVIVIAASTVFDTGLFITFVYSSVLFLQQIAGISCGHSADYRILNGWSTDPTLTQSFKPDIQALTKTTVPHCIAIKSAFYLTVTLSLLYLFSTGFSIGLFWKKYAMRGNEGGRNRGGKSVHQQYSNQFQRHGN